MVRLLPVFILSGFLVFNSNGFAETPKTGLYVGAQVGGVFRPDTRLTSSTLGSEKVEFKPGYTFGGFLGYDFGRGIGLKARLLTGRTCFAPAGVKIPRQAPPY